MAEQPRTPLTLEYEPEGLDDDTDAKPFIVIEPSFQHHGRIFIGIHPMGKRFGCHLLPEDAQRVRDHLSKLLMTEPPALPEGEAVDWKQRIEAAAQRAQTTKPKRRRKLKRPKLAFRFEFALGRFQGVVGTSNE